MFLLMKVSGIALDPFTNTPIVILKDTDNEKTLPIWIGFMEASSIAMELEKTPRIRPITHDLVKNLLEKLKFVVTKIEVTDLKDDTFYARIYLKRDKEEYSLDSRPSDAIALAVRYGAQIYVSTSVMDEAAFVPEEEEEEPPTKQQKKKPETKISKLDQLRLELKDAVEQENYEKAATLRDEIRKLESRD